MPLLSSVTELITGGAGASGMFTGIRLAGVISTPLAESLTVSVMVPAVDPVAKSIAGMAAVLLAGIWITSVVVLLGKSTAGSVTVLGGFGVNSSVSVAVIGAG